jgi:hypothetical protein
MGIFAEHPIGNSTLPHKIVSRFVFSERAKGAFRPHTVTLPQVLDCLATPMTKEEVE